MKRIEKLQTLMGMHPDLLFFLKYSMLFTMLLLSIASLALNRIIATESIPFFYANF